MKKINLSKQVKHEAKIWISIFLSTEKLSKFTSKNDLEAFELKISFYTCSDCHLVWNHLRKDYKLALADYVGKEIRSQLSLK